MAKRPRVSQSLTARAQRAGVVIQYDYREQDRVRWRFPGFETESATIPNGDYTVKGVSVIIERKAEGDYFQSIFARYRSTRARKDGTGLLKSFRDELCALSQLPPGRAYIIVESPHTCLYDPLRMTSIDTGRCIVKTAAIMVSYGIPILFCSTPLQARDMALALMLKAWDVEQKKLQGETDNAD